MFRGVLGPSALQYISITAPILPLPCFRVFFLAAPVSLPPHPCLKKWCSKLVSASARGALRHPQGPSWPPQVFARVSVVGVLRTVTAPMLKVLCQLGCSASLQHNPVTHRHAMPTSPKTQLETLHGNQGFECAGALAALGPSGQGKPSPRCSAAMRRARARCSRNCHARCTLKRVRRSH